MLLDANGCEWMGMGGNGYEWTRMDGNARIAFPPLLEIRQKILPSNHPDLATSCSVIGLVYYHKDEYSRVPSFFERALAIRQYSLPPNDLRLETLRQNIEIIRKKL
jgi:predicted metallo-beta-lactamase superfamily hydrolase